MLHAAEAVSDPSRKEAPPLYAVMENYDAMLSAIVRRAAERGLSYSDLDKIANLPSGYAGKALGPSQTCKLGWLSTYAVAWALGLGVAFVEDEKAAAAVADLALPRQANQARPNNYAARSGKRVRTRVFREFAALGRKTYATATAPELRKAIARHAALKRWYPDRAYDWNEIKKANVLGR
jgi:hypothetical protein